MHSHQFLRRLLHRANIQISAHMPARHATTGAPRRPDQAAIAVHLAAVVASWIVVGWGCGHGEAHDVIGKQSVQTTVQGPNGPRRLDREADHLPPRLIHGSGAAA